MNNMVKALIAEIQEQLSVAFLTKALIRVFTAIHTSPTDLPDEATVMTDVTAGDMRKIGAFWNHDDLMASLSAYIASAINAQTFGDIAMLVARETEDILAIARAPEDNSKAALVIAIAHMNQEYPGVELDVVAGQQLRDKEDEAMNNGLDRLLQAAASLVAENDPMMHEAPATLQ